MGRDGWTTAVMLWVVLLVVGSKESKWKGREKRGGGRRSEVIWKAGEKRQMEQGEMLKDGDVR